MKVVLINGQNHKGSTYQIGKKLADKLKGELTEIFLPRDFGDFCVGCSTCFMKSETKCPHYDKLKPITKAMDEADVIILTSPVYVYHVTGSMKAFLDHYGYRWMVHRPNEKMFSKQAVCISTAAGAGMKSTNKDMADSLFFWGIPKIYKYGVAVRAISYEEISEKIWKQIENQTTRLTKKILKREGKVRIGIKTKAFFYIMHLVQKKGWNIADKEYWDQKEWNKKKRPWK
jgi:multimeric flavodoxin WrbA